VTGSKELKGNFIMTFFRENILIDIGQGTRRMFNKSQGAVTIGSWIS